MFRCFSPCNGLMSQQNVVQNKSKGKECWLILIDGLHQHWLHPHLKCLHKNLVCNIEQSDGVPIRKLFFFPSFMQKCCQHSCNPKREIVVHNRVLDHLHVHFTYTTTKFGCSSLVFVHLNQWIHYFFIGPHSLQPMNSFKI